MATPLDPRQRNKMDRFMERFHPRCSKCGYGPPPPSDPTSSLTVPTSGPLLERTYSFVAGKGGPDSLVEAVCGKCGHKEQFDRKIALDE